MQVVEAEIKCFGESSNGQESGRRDPAVLKAADRIYSYRRVLRKIRGGALSLLTADGNQTSKPPAVLSILIRSLLATHRR